MVNKDDSRLKCSFCGKTQDQVKKLEMMLLNEHHEGIKAALEHEKSFGKLEKAIGNLPGPIGQVTKALGGWGGKLGMIVGAFQTGFAIGEKLRETTGKIYEWAKGLDEVRQLTEFAKQQFACSRISTLW